MGDKKLSRRWVLEGVGAVVVGTVAGSKLATGQTATAPAPGRGATETATPRLAPRDELVNTLEFEEEAKRKLSPVIYPLIAGGRKTRLAPA